MTLVDVTIAHVVQETPLDRSFLLEVPSEHRAAFAFAPGQFIRLRDPADDDARDWYFSLSAAPSDDGILRITVRGRGEAVQRIYTARPGATWKTAPPAGDFGIGAPPGERIVLVGAGSGVTPFRAFVEHRSIEGVEDPVWLLQCARRADELLFRRDFAAWSDAVESFTYVPSVTSKDDASWGGRRGRIDAEVLEPALGTPEQTRLYACGPARFVDAVLELATALGVPADRRLRETW